MGGATQGRAADAFRRITGRSPDGVWSAPGRVNLIGEHTDYSGGLVLPIAIDRRATVAAGLRNDGVIRCASLQFGGEITATAAAIRPGDGNGWAAPLLGVAWAVGTAGVGVPGADLVVDSDIPPGGGLASSAAVEVAAALALTELTRQRMSTGELARCCQRGEHHIARAPTGIMDPIAVLLGRVDQAVFLDCRTLEHQLVPFAPATVGLSLVVIDTAVHHDNRGPGYRERRQESETAAHLLRVGSLRDATPADIERRLEGTPRRRARHVVTENLRVAEAVELLRAGSLSMLGPLLDASHASLRDDFEVSCPELDLAAASARSAGALGARMTGAGFGGSAIALVRGADVDRLCSEVQRAFADAGLGEPRLFEVAAADGAARVA